MKRALILGIFLMLFSLAPGAQTPPVFRTLDGGEFVSLEQYTGDKRWLVVMIWASDCHVCNQEAHNYEAFHKARKDQNARMLGISVDGWDGRAAAADFASRHKLSFPNLIIEPEQMSLLLMGMTGQGLDGTPSFLVFDPSGTIKAQQTGAVPVPIIEEFIRQESAAAG